MDANIAAKWNKHYTYDNIDLWKAEAWKDRYSPICGLVQRIEEKNHQITRSHTSSGKFAGRTDGIYDSKTRSLAYPDTVDDWDKKGLFYKCSELGGTCWIAMVPHAVREGRNNDPVILVVLHDADYANPHWAMETLEYYREYNELAAREGLLVLYIVFNGPDQDHVHVPILQELSALFHLKMIKVYLDVSTVFLADSKLSDESVEQIGNIPVVNITGRWQDKVSLLYRCVTSPMNIHPAFDPKRLIHSACGRKMAEGMFLEHTYQDALDPELLKYWEAKGLRYESHFRNGEPWVTLAPLSSYEDADQKLPVLLIFQEVNSAFQALSALSHYCEYCAIVAQGQLICIFFALETPDDNDLFIDILHDAAEILPIDMRRVYVSGQSHNGHFAAEFMRRHYKEIAAVATLSMSHGLLAPAYSYEAVKITDEMVDLMSTFDMPLININGIVENEFANCDIDAPGFKNVVDSWQRRLKAFNCPQKTDDEITASRASADLATRMVGVPNDGTDIQYRYGCECYIADVQNNAGKKHLRLVTLENMPHMPAPQMPALSWDFLSRFARDLETGEVLELY